MKKKKCPYDLNINCLCRGCGAWQYSAEETRGRSMIAESKEILIGNGFRDEEIEEVSREKIIYQWLGLKKETISETHFIGCIEPKELPEDKKVGFCIRL